MEQLLSEGRPRLLTQGGDELPELLPIRRFPAVSADPEAPSGGAGNNPQAPSPACILESVKDLQCLLDLTPPEKDWELVFQSASMQHVVEQALRFARSSATVLLTGESGTGKELVARLIHDHSPRADQRYERVNCAALSETLMESELFGHHRGAFTGAVETRLGRFEWASGGTLLLDEISELPLNVQAKLLRVLEQEEFQRVGDNETRRTNVRVIATTNRDLPAEVNRGGFRGDLYHRLNVLEIRLPPLRERPDDIPLLISRFITWFRDDADAPLRGVSAPAMQVLMQYAWPGNVRELRNVIHRACVLATAELIQPDDLPPLSAGPDALPPAWMHQTLDEIERQVILHTLRRFRGNKTAAALHLGITARTLTNKLKRYRQQEAA